jgi:hypothetical protein
MNREELANMKYIDLRRLAKNLGLQSIGKVFSFILVTL